MARTYARLSPALNEALEKHERFFVADDAERSDVMSDADSATLHQLAAFPQPLFDEINAVLDELNSKDSLSEEEQQLDEDLNTLGQAAMEARYELEDRGEAAD